MGREYKVKGLWSRAVPGLVLGIGLGTAVAADPLGVPIRPSERSLESPGVLPDKAPEGFELPPATPEAPATSATVEVRAIAFEGNEVIPTEELLAITRPFVGRRLSAAEIEELRHELTRHYIGKGYLNSGATLKPGAYRDGTLTFHIVEGRLEAVRLTGMERLRESYVRDRLRRGDEALNVNVLQERFQLLLTDPLFAKMNARLSPGSVPG